MPMNAKQAEVVVKQIIDSASKLFYKGAAPTVFGMKLVPVVKVVAGNIPNGNLAPATGGMGIEVSKGLLAIADDVAIKFALAHELGHAFSETILTRVGMAGISGPATEVIADLAAAYMLVQNGHTWQQVLGSVRSWAVSGIFDANAQGDHPPGARRVTYVESLASMMTHATVTRSFEAAAKLICSNL